ncbi:MAG TPA: SIMPL domain-containing protein [Paludibacteraceae bacterium]|nr:SIMPL domain-containing protein [Paludibacteraceae bacterium]
MKNRIVEATIIAVGIICLGLCIQNGIKIFSQKDRAVEVKGLAEMEVPANKVICPILYKDLGNDLAQLYIELNKKNKAIISFLKENGIHDSEISVSAPEIVDMEAERFIENKSPYRYNLTSVITITTENVDKVRALMSRQAELLKQGIAVTVNNYSVRYEYTKLNEIKPQMIEEATKNARKAAEKFAKDSGSKLGKIKNATQGQFVISNRDENTPYIKNIRVVSTITYYLED